ncbi:MAG: hypothetical protein M1476_05785 [Candidatus Thermoplasmatota archaeon]|nr:hypothetical protein [Candidatus Thermoplasmatota archaeon]
MHRRLYRYNNRSNHGKYHTRVPGLLDRKKHLRYPNGAFLLQSGEDREAMDFLKRNKVDTAS